MIAMIVKKFVCDATSAPFFGLTGALVVGVLVVGVSVVVLTITMGVIVRNPFVFRLCVCVFYMVRDRSRFAWA